MSCSGGEERERGGHGRNNEEEIWPLPRLHRVMGAFRHLLMCPTRHNHTMPSSPPPPSSSSSSSSSSLFSLSSLSPLLADSVVIDALPSASISANPGALEGKGRCWVQAEQIACLPEPLTQAQTQKVAELHAICRHLEVRWHLFNEALYKFCDLEAMLAIFTDDVIWRSSGSSLMKGKEEKLVQLLKSLITRKLSLHVDIDKITSIVLIPPSSSIGLDLTLDAKLGSYGHLVGAEFYQASLALDVLFFPKPISSGSHLPMPLLILEKDNYTLLNDQGEEVESGMRTILWEQHNETWYIRGHLSYPDNHMP